MNFHITPNPEKSNENVIKLNTYFWPKMNFIEKMGSVSFQILQLSTIMQKNVKIDALLPKKSVN